MSEEPLLSPGTVINSKTRYVEVLDGDVRIQIAQDTPRSKTVRLLRQLAGILEDSATYKDVMR